MKEIMPEKTVRPESGPLSLSEFLRTVVKEAATPIARFGMDPTELTEFELKRLGGKDEEIAQTLSEVEIIDPYYKKQTSGLVFPIPDESIPYALLVTVAKAEAVISEHPKLESRLKKFENTIFDKVGGIIAGIGGRKALAATSALSLLITSCGVARAGFQTAPTPTERPAITEPYYPTATPEPKDQFPPDWVYDGKTIEYRGEEAQIIERAKQDFGVTIISPAVWEDNGKEKENLAWNLKEISLMVQALSQLPPEYLKSKRAPKEILLLKTPGSTSEGAGGGYASRLLLINISENFKPEALMHGPQGIFGFQADQLRAAVIHEYTHSFMEANPDLIKDWIAKTDWQKDASGNWNNQRPQDLIAGIGADKDPGEDLAVSASLMVVNPAVLSAERISFFLKNSYFSNTKWFSLSRK